MSFGSQPKSTGGGRSQGTRAHLGATGKTQEKHQDLQFEERLKADREKLSSLEGKRTREAAERAKLRIKKETAVERRAQKDRVKKIDLAFNMRPDGTEVSDAEVDQIVKAAASVDHYWKDCGGKRAGEFKAVPLGGSVDNLGRANDPTRYLAINARPWHTWGLLDATEAGLPGKAFLKHAVLLFAPIFQNMTGIRALVWPVHKKANNIHIQPMMCCITSPCPRPGKQPKQKRKDEKVAGLLLTHPDRRGRGHSPLDWALVGKTVCSLQHLRLAGFDLPALTGDPEILVQLKSWIDYAEKSGHKALDLEAEKELDKCILDAVEAFPAFRPYFDKAWERYKLQKEKEVAAIMAEIAKDTRELENQNWKDRCARLERDNAEIKEGAQMIHENAKAVVAENNAVKKTRPSQPTALGSGAEEAIRTNAKSEMRRQFEVLRELESFIVALSIANSSKAPIAMKPNWGPLHEKAPCGDLRPSKKFFDVLASLTDFVEEADELRHRVELWNVSLDVEPQQSCKAQTKEPSLD